MSVCVVGCGLYTETTCFVIGRKKQNKTTTKMEHDGKRGGQAAEDLKMLFLCGFKHYSQHLTITGSTYCMLNE